MLLRLWCEQQLCECIDVDGACDVLRQAHLYEAKQLEAACLDFVKANMAAVAVTPAHVHVRVTAGAPTRARGHEEARMRRCRPVVALWGLRGGNGSCQCPDVGSSVRSTGRRWRY